MYSSEALPELKVKRKLRNTLYDIVTQLDIDCSGAIEWVEFLALERLTQRREVLL